MNPTIVKGHVTTWKITPTEDGQYRVTPGSKSYKDMKTAKWAIRTAEERYMKDHPMHPVANRDVWFDHGILIVDDWDGNYYESAPSKIATTDKVIESNTTGQYVWCEYRYVTSHSAEELMKFAQMLYSTKYYTRVKVTGIEKQEYSHTEGHQVYKMSAEGLHEDFDSFYFLVQCTEDEANELPDGNVTESSESDTCPACGQKYSEDGRCYNSQCKEYDPISQYFDAMNNLEYVGGHATYDVDKFNWTHERCWLSVYDNDADKEIEIEVCKGVGDEENGRNVALEILQDEEFNVPKDVRNELISTFGLDDFGFKIEESEDQQYQLVFPSVGWTRTLQKKFGGRTKSQVLIKGNNGYPDTKQYFWITNSKEDYESAKEYSNQNGAVTESMKDYRFQVSCNDGPIDIIKLVWDDKDPGGAKEMAKKYYSDKHTTYADDRQNNWTIEESISESKIETDPEKLAQAEVTNEPQDDETLADKIEKEIHQPDIFVGKKCIYTYKGLIDDLSCYGFDDNEQKLKDASGKEVEVISGCSEYGYAIKVDGKELYGVSGEELVVHEDSSRVEEVPSDK